MAEGSGTALTPNVADESAALPAPPLSSVTSKKMSKKLDGANVTESVSSFGPAAPTDFAVVEQPVGEFPVKFPAPQTSKVPVAAPLPVIVGELSDTDADVSNPAARTRKIKSSNCPAFAASVNPSINVVLNWLPPGVTVTFAGLITVAPFSPGTIVNDW